jgi:hypothetical protein
LVNDFYSVSRQAQGLVPRIGANLQHALGAGHVRGQAEHPALQCGGGCGG